MTTNAVFFDLYNTLARFYPPREELQAQACADFGIHVSAQGITRGYTRADAFMTRENKLLPLRKRSPEEQARFFARYEQLVLQGAGVEVSEEEAGRTYARVRQIPYDLALYDDSLPTLTRLKEMGLITGLISNINRDVTALCQRLGLAPYLDLIVTSMEAGSEKPHPPIFKAALARARVKPGEALMVGDQYEGDVLGARGVGMRAVLLDREGLLDNVTDCPRIRTLVEVFDYL